MSTLPTSLGQYDCLHCGSPIPATKRKNQAKFCSRTCGNKHWRELNVETYDPSTLDRGRIGALSEMTASADLIGRGLHVFRALAPTCPCDLIAMGENGRLWRIEVRTGHRSSRTGLAMWGCKEHDRHRADLYAVVVHEGIVEVSYYTTDKSPFVWPSATPR